MITDTLVNITINGQSLHASPGQTVLEAAQRAGIDIPTLCHHPHLRSSGSCRVCLVEIEKNRALQPACTFPIFDGMIVQTETPRVVEARKFSLHMLFSERNHYCMFCPSSGTPQTSECELQRLAYRYGLDCFSYAPKYESAWEVDATRKRFIMDQARCVLCRRCIRACDEIAANHTLGVLRRGARSMVCADDAVDFGDSTCVECGTCLQVCPTGALMDRRSAFIAHGCQTRRVKTTCVGCSVGCGIVAQVRANTVIKIEGDWEANNQGLLCSLGRFDSLELPDQRIRKPMLRDGLAMREVDWDAAINHCASRLRDASTVAGLISPRFTTETMIAFGAFFNEVLHSDQVALLGGQVPPLDLAPRATMPDLASASCVIVVGGDPLQRQKVLGALAKRVRDREASLIVVDEKDTGLDDSATERLFLSVMSHDRPSPFAALRYTYHLSMEGMSRLRGMAEGAKDVVVLYGPALSTLVYAALRNLPANTRFMPLVNGTNACGAARLGIMPEPVDAEALYVMAGDERPNDTTLPDARFTIVQAAFASELTRHADVVLPGRLWTEKRGTILNAEGIERRVKDITEAPAGIGPDWLPLATMAAVLGRPGLFASIAQVQNSL